MRRKIVAVIGNKSIEADGIRYRLAFETGKLLIDNGYRIQSGGLGGVMEAVFKGAHASEKYREGDTVALVPSFDAETANAYADIAIPTGIDMMRNALVANADAVIGIGRRRGYDVRVCVRLVAETSHHRLSQFGRVERKTGGYPPRRHRALSRASRRSGLRCRGRKNGHKNFERTNRPPMPYAIRESVKLKNAYFKTRKIQFSAFFQKMRLKCLKALILKGKSDII